MLPNFIIVGAPRSGTTSLYRYCAEHPDIFMSLFKETNFFSSNPYGFTRSSYEELFKSAVSAKAIGEASPSYLHQEGAAYAIKGDIPDCRIVMLLRNPVERLISAFFYSRSWGCNLDVTFREFVSGCLEHGASARGKFAPRDMVQKGMYAAQVKRFVTLFSSDRIFLRLYEDLESDPAFLMAELYEFLNVDSTFRPMVSEVHNVTSDPVFPLLSRVVVRSRCIERKLLDPLLPATMRGRMTKTVLGLNRRRRSLDTRNRPIQKEDRLRLTALYRRDMEDLQALIGRDLSAWMK